MIGDRWGVTEAEVATEAPCDAFVPQPTLRASRGVTVAAPAGALWPWVAQIRLAPYSYDLVDNLGRRSPRRLVGLPEPRVGEPFTRCAGRPVGRVVAVEPGRSLTGDIGGTVMSYVLAPVDDATTRLLLTVVSALPRVLAPALSVGDLVMARRQLRTFAALAAGRA